METGGSRRRRTLSDENLDSPNLRDFLRLKEEDENNNHNNNNGTSNSLSGLTLRAVLSSGKRPPPQQQQPFHVNRTLLDVIKDDPNYGKESKKSWKALKSKLRLRRAGAAWTSSVITPASDVPMVQNPSRTISRRLSTRFNSDGPSPDPTPSVPESTQLNSAPSSNRGAMMMRRNSSRVPSMAAGGYGRGFEGSGSLSNSREAMWDGGDGGSNGNENGAVSVAEGAAEGEGEEEGVGETEEGGGEPRMSLMALLAETDRQMGLDGSNYITGNDDDDDEEEEVESGGGGEYNSCCVCMVRHKGAAFIPCGHTFCRLCSRELWVQRGNCPLCNGFILEVLDIF